MKAFRSLSCIAATVTVFVLSGLPVAGVSQVSAAGATYPQKGKYIQIIVPFSPGGSTDVQTRIIADFMQKDLGTSIEVVDKPGAGSQVGLQAIASAKPDG
jgi:tripartite-type tricarboxylate transporter receptor subunit TctC